MTVGLVTIHNHLPRKFTHARTYPGAVRTKTKRRFEGKIGLIVLDQLRTVDKTRLVKRLGQLSADEQTVVLQVLAEMSAQ